MKENDGIKEILSSLDDGINYGTLKNKNTLKKEENLSKYAIYTIIFFVLPISSYFNIFSVIIFLIPGFFIAFNYVKNLNAIQFVHIFKDIKNTISLYELEENDFSFIFSDNNKRNKKELKKHLKYCKKIICYKFNIKEIKENKNSIIKI